LRLPLSHTYILPLFKYRSRGKISTTNKTMVVVVSLVGVCGVFMRGWLV